MSKPPFVVMRPRCGCPSPLAKYGRIEKAKTRVGHDGQRILKPSGPGSSVVWLLTPLIEPAENAPSGEAALEKLLAVLDERIATTSDEDRRGRPVKFRDGALAAGRDAAVGVLTGVLSPGRAVM